MTVVFEGFATIAALILAGVAMGHCGLLDLRGQQALSAVAFHVAIPALLLTVLADSEPSAVFSPILAAAASAIALTALLHVLVACIALRRGASELVIGATAASWSNAGNLGIPIAAYVLGDAALVAPIVLFQLVIMQPLTMIALDMAAAEAGASHLRTVARPLLTPMTAAAVVGLSLGGTDTPIPLVLRDSLDLFAAMAVPSMLVAYGLYLRLGPRGASLANADLAVVSVLKLIAQPVSAWAIGTFVFGLDRSALLAVTVISALPTAQQVFVIASRYDVGVELARDAVLVTTILAVPILCVTVAALA